LFFAFGQLLRDPLSVPKGDSVNLHEILQHLVRFCGIVTVGIKVSHNLSLLRDVTSANFNMVRFCEVPQQHVTVHVGPSGFAA
jgi:hypothetical protein